MGGKCKTKLHTWRPTPIASWNINFCDRVGQILDTGLQIVAEVTEEVNKMILKTGRRFSPNLYDNSLSPHTVTDGLLVIQLS